MYFTTDPAPSQVRALPLYKTLLCFACVLILVVNGYFLLRNLDGLKAANALQERTSQVTDELQHLNLLVTDAESNLRGYFLSSSDSYLGSVQAAPARIGQQLDKLGTLLADNPSQQKNLVQLRSLVERQLGMMQQAMTICCCCSTAWCGAASARARMPSTPCSRPTNSWNPSLPAVPSSCRCCRAT